jgi:hypothetical protein
MGFTSDEAKKTRNQNVKGGLICLVDKKVWQGVVRHKESNKILWTCDHVHSTPEYNTRSRDDYRMVWEYSALNCGRYAAEQWVHVLPNDPDRLVGAYGQINAVFYSGTSRDDYRMVQIGETFYEGWIRLQTSGDRLLWVRKAGSANDAAWPGAIFPDRPTDNSKWPDMDIARLNLWLTAAGMLLSKVWGLSFQGSKTIWQVPGVIPEQVLRLTPKQRVRSRTSAHIRPVRKDGKRLFEVIDHKGNVVMAVPHRGKAAKELKKLEGSTP